MINIGITGIIGSGKTIVCDILNTTGIKIYNADYFAKYLINTDKRIIKSLKNKFGESIYLNEKVNKKLLANLIFNNNSNRLFVNNIVHPIVEEHYISWRNKQTSQFTCIESALIYEAKLDKLLDAVILIESPHNIIIERICKRDNISKHDAELRIKSQRKNERTNKNNEYRIINNNKESIILQTLSVIQKITTNLKK